MSRTEDVENPGQTGGRLKQGVLYAATCGSVAAALLVFIWPWAPWALLVGVGLGWIAVFVQSAHLWIFGDGGFSLLGC